MRKSSFFAVFGATVAVASLCALGWTVGKVRAFERAHPGCDVFANAVGVREADAPGKMNWWSASAPAENPAGGAHPTANSTGSEDDSTGGAGVSPAQKEEEPTAPKADTPAAPPSPPEMKVLGVEYDGDSILDIHLSERPDMDVVRNYVEVSPLVEGVAGFSYRARRNYETDEFEPHLRVSGEFAYRTNVTVLVRRGLPLYDKGRDPSAAGSLAEDWTYTFRRKDAEPYVKFVSDGRYLPPGGMRAVAVEAMNVSNVYAEVRRVEPRNVVQLLARDEGVYNMAWRDGVDREDTGELAGECETNMLRCVNRVNAKETLTLPIAMGDGGPGRGVFLVAIRNGDFPRRDWTYWNSDEVRNPNKYRLVCVSDLGLSVRTAGDSVGVWVTSLTTGRPVAGAWVEVYSTANIKVAEGRADGNGWCMTRRVAKGEPFAVVALSPDADDMTFMALRNSMEVDETYPDGARDAYLATNECAAFVWTERGIYRHGEKVLLNVVLRDGTGAAPRPFPVEIVLRSPQGADYSRVTLKPDERGLLSYEKFSVPAEQPSGVWTFAVKTPGEDGRLLGERDVKIEEFAPPQIRVGVSAGEGQAPSNFAFAVSAEHLYGGPARSLAVEGAVVFEDVPFAPERWKGFRFGNDDLGLKPSFRRLGRSVLDGDGRASFDAPLWADRGLPKAAVRATAQGTVFEDGGRPATARRSVILHHYPLYVGATLPEWVRKPEAGPARFSVVCVSPDGVPLAEGRKLSMKIERIDTVYSYRRGENGWSTWDATRVRTPCVDAVDVETSADGPVEIDLPLAECGEYALTLSDAESGASFGRTFYLSDWGDEAVRAPLANPTEVTIRPDKAFYRPGETPRLIVKSPFVGHAMLGVFRDGWVHARVLALTNATCEVELPEAAAAWAPNVDVTISVVQGAEAGSKHLAVRAHGETTVAVRRPENEYEVDLDAVVDASCDGGAKVEVFVFAEGADVEGAVATVTVVDEGINILTGEETPDPIGFFSSPRTANHPLHDLYGRLLPVLGDSLRANGVKTGGGFGAEMLGRVSPVPTRRFKPLALWQTDVPLEDGRAKAAFSLPEFVGEVRVTAVVCSSRAAGAKSVQRKVTPRLVIQPDAPRFVAPGDEFEIALPVSNRSGEAGEAAYAVEASGEVELERVEGVLRLEKDGSTNVFLRAKAKGVGQGVVRFSATGFGERHSSDIELPVRPAVAWRETAGVVRIEPGGERTLPGAEGPSRREVTASGSSVAELAAAREWLADYPHGCLEQTTSRIFPLVAAGGVLNSVGSRKEGGRADYVAAGVRRVESMVRANDFTMWPDCNYAPWDREVSIYAAHFLVEAEKAGTALNQAARKKVMGMLGKWAMSTNDTESAYSCLALALAGEPEKDRMLRLYDRSAELRLLSRARLALAFASTGDRPRAESLLSNASSPDSVKEAAFALMALLEIDPDDARIPPLVAYLTERRDGERFSWGTTCENAHALVALGEYYRRHPAKGGAPRVAVAEGSGEAATLGERESRRFDGGGELRLVNAGEADAFVSWKALTLPDPASVAEESSGISVARRFLTPEGEPADMDGLSRGDMLVVELRVSCDDTRTLSDLVVEDLFAGAFEPIHSPLDPTRFAWCARTGPDWVMRSDARDDRMLVFSKRFVLEKGNEARFFYPVRVVSAGSFALPGPSVEGMYAPSLRARGAAGRVVVRH